MYKNYLAWGLVLGALKETAIFWAKYASDWKRGMSIPETGTTTVSKLPFHQMLLGFYIHVQEDAAIQTYESPVPTPSPEPAPVPAPA